MPIKHYEKFILPLGLPRVYQNSDSLALVLTGIWKCKISV
jgi:hypothetical protein